MSFSMSGFGRGQVRTTQVKATVEIRTVNHKYLDLSMKLPNGCNIFESRIKEQVQQFIKRGKVNLFLTCELNNTDKQDLIIDMQKAKRCYRALKNLNKQLHLDSPIKMEQILMFPNVLKVEEEAIDYAAIWPIVKQAVNKALEHLNRMRRKEGHALAKDILHRIGKIKSVVLAIKARLPKAILLYRQKLEKRLHVIKSGIDRDKFETDIALFAKNCDVTEEITRTLSLLDTFRQALRKEKEVGKKLDFITQELHRETNTIGSKAQDFEISQYVIKIKSEVEKIREQVQNIE